jgi:hypothetical protein
MKEPKRLLSRGATDFERQLLRAVVNERPSALLRSRMQRGLGLVGPLAWASTVKAMFGSAAAKVTGLVALGVLAAAGFTAFNLVPDEESAVAPLSAASPAVSVATPSAETVSEPPAPAVAKEAAPAPVVAANEPSVNGAAVAEAAAATTAPAPEVVPAPEAAADEDDRRLREEIALLDTARAALERGDREAARSSLWSYRERFPTGVLAREASVLRRRAEPARAKQRSDR